jgi:hypothetical protein
MKCQGVKIMPTIVQQIKNEIANKYKDEVVKARDEAAKARDEADKAREEIARKLIQKGMDVNMIVDIIGISREKLEKIAAATH